MTNSASRCTAHHEAAHAVIYLHYGIKVDQITLSCCGDGFCTVADNLPSSYELVIAKLAGPEADKRLLADDVEALGRRKNGWKKDLDDADELFRKLNRGDSIEAAVAESARLVNENWQTICSLAEQLISQSEDNFVEGALQSIMLSSEVKKYVERFRAERTVDPR